MMFNKPTLYAVTALASVTLALPLAARAEDAPKPSDATTTTAPAEPAKPPAPGVVATVNGTNVTRDALVDYMMNRFGTAALQQMIDSMIIDQAADKAGIKITQQDLDTAYEAYKSTAPTPQVFEDYEKRNGKDNIMQNVVRPQVLREKIGEMLVKVDDSDLDEVKASHILIKPAPATDDAGKAKADADALKKAQDVLAEAKKPGADFAALAQKYSDDTGSKASGGELGYFTRFKMVKPFEDAAFAAKTGDIVGPVKSDFGYHIIKIEDRKTAAQQTPSEVSKTRTQIVMRKAGSAINQWIEKQRNDAVVEKYDLNAK
jgi:parvulin-like peptidyl-prolyl isomerase